MAAWLRERLWERIELIMELCPPLGASSRGANVTGGCKAGRYTSEHIGEIAEYRGHDIKKKSGYQACLLTRG